MFERRCGFCGTLASLVTNPGALDTFSDGVRILIGEEVEDAVACWKTSKGLKFGARSFEKNKPDIDSANLWAPSRLAATLF